MVKIPDAVFLGRIRGRQFVTSLIINHERSLTSKRSVVQTPIKDLFTKQKDYLTHTLDFEWLLHVLSSDTVRR